MSRSSPFSSCGFLTEFGRNSDSFQPFLMKFGVGEATDYESTSLEVSNAEMLILCKML